MSQILVIHELIVQAQRIAITQIDGGGRIAALRAELSAGEARIRDLIAAEEVRLAPLRVEIEQLSGPSRDADNEFEAIGRKLEVHNVSRDQLQEIVDGHVEMMKSMGLVGGASISHSPPTSTSIPVIVSTAAPVASAPVLAPEIAAEAPIPAPPVASDDKAASQHAAPEAPVASVATETTATTPRVRRSRPAPVVTPPPASVEPVSEADVEFGDAERNTGDDQTVSSGVVSPEDLDSVGTSFDAPIEEPIFDAAPAHLSEPTDIAAEQVHAPPAVVLSVPHEEIKEPAAIELSSQSVPAAPQAPVAAPRPSWMQPSQPAVAPGSTPASIPSAVVHAPAAEPLAAAPQPSWMPAPKSAASPSPVVPTGPTPTPSVAPGAPVIPVFLRNNG